MWKLLVVTHSLSFVTLGVTARRNWHNSGAGTIIFEEAWTIPELLDATGTDSGIYSATILI